MGTHDQWPPFPWPHGTPLTEIPPDSPLLKNVRLFPALLLGAVQQRAPFPTCPCTCVALGAIPASRIYAPKILSGIFELPSSAF